MLGSALLLLQHSKTPSLQYSMVLIIENLKQH
jgi:hypothetical protein